MTVFESVSVNGAKKVRSQLAPLRMASRRLTHTRWVGYNIQLRLPCRSALVVGFLFPLRGSRNADLRKARPSTPLRATVERPSVRDAPSTLSRGRSDGTIFLF
jgi:hypothetical protein